MAERVLKQFGNSLLSRRRANGWSQARLAVEAKMPRRYIGDLEAGRKNVSLMTVAKLASAFGIQPEQLFEDVKLVTPKPKRVRETLVAKVQQIARHGSDAQVVRLNLFIDELL